MLLEVPPYGCCPPWPETIGCVAEWCGRDAGRGCAGVGSKGAARVISYVGGVRAARPVTSCDSAREFPWRDEGAICQGGGVHCGGEDTNYSLKTRRLFCR